MTSLALVNVQSAYDDKTYSGLNSAFCFPLTTRHQWAN